MRRSMASMLAALACLSTPLTAQVEGQGEVGATAGQSTGATWGLGLAATVGTGWQIEGGEIGRQQRVRAGPIQFVSAAIRLGSFIDAGQIIGGARGFIAALALGARTGAVPLFEVGQEDFPTRVKLDLTLEVAGYLGSRSPIPQGSRWTTVALLPGIRVGEPDGMQFHLVAGPTAFLGGDTDLRAFIGLRFEAPLARREPRP